MLWASALSVLSIATIVMWLLPKSHSQAPKTALAVPVSEDEHSHGNPDAKVTVVIYSDLQCSACAAFNELSQRIETDYQDRVRFVHRHFALPQHKNAVVAAVAAEAADKQGKFFEMRDAIFRTQKDWSNRTPHQVELYIAALASNLGLDSNQFLKDLQDRRLLQRVTQDLESGKESNIQSAPSFFINGKSVSPTSETEFRRMIDAVLDKQ